MTSKKPPSVFLILTVICFTALIGNKHISAQTEVASNKDFKEIFYDNSNLGSDYERQMVTDVLVDYMLLKNSLAKGKAADARFTSLTMISVIADYRSVMDPNLLTDPKKFSDDMAALKEKVKKSATLDEVRTNFITLNNLFADFIKSYGLYNKTVYIFQCNENETRSSMYWISDSMTDTRNPYLDHNSEADCYKVKESWIFR